MSKKNTLELLQDMIIPIPENRNWYYVMPVSKSEIENSSGKTVAYCAVDTNNQENELDFQELRILKYCNSQRINIDEFVREIWVESDGNRVELERILKDPTITSIIVDQRERIAQSSFNLIKHCLEAQNRIIVVVNDE